MGESMQQRRITELLRPLLEWWLNAVGASPWWARISLSTGGSTILGGATFIGLQTARGIIWVTDNAANGRRW